MHKKLLVLLVAAFAAACSEENSAPTGPINDSPGLVPAAVLSASTFGDATALGGGSYRLRSDYNAGPGFGGLDYNTPSAFKFDDINVLQAEQMPEPDDACVGGSPRFQLSVDTDGDGDHDGNVFVHTEFAVGGCPGDTGDLTGPAGEIPGTYELGQIGGPVFATYSQAQAYFAANPGFNIIDITFVVDSGWAFGDNEQTITVTPTVDVELGEPANKDACKKGGWQNLQRADGTRFKNQGDCIQYVNTGK